MGRLVNKSEKLKSSLNVYVLIFYLIVFAALLTYIVPAGEFHREEVNGRTVIQPDSFQYTDGNPLGFLGIFSSIHLGMLEGASIIFFVLIVGGAFSILNTKK